MTPLSKPLLLLPLLLLLFVSSVFSKSSDKSSISVASMLSINGHFGHNNNLNDAEQQVGNDLLGDHINSKKYNLEKRSLFELFHPRFPLFGWQVGRDEPTNPDFETVVEEARPDFGTNSLGKWRITTKNVGVSAMQLQLMPNNKVVWFDTTYLGDSAYRLTANCPKNFERGYKDCFAHALEYDADTDVTRPLNVKSDPWCSVGSLSAEGNLISTGGYYQGRRAVRILEPCTNCDFYEKSDLLGSNRWYASQHILEDGSIVIVGGRQSFTYEIIPPDSLNFPIKQFNLPFLQQTTDPVENNLYPFLYLTPDGNLFIFANDRAIILDPKTGQTIQEFPPLSGGSRNYPASGMSALLPIKLDPENPLDVNIEVLICGGNFHDAFSHVDQVKKPKPKGVFLPALQDCGKISITKENSQWEKEMMLSPRIMGDMLILPTGDLLLLSGAKHGTAGWWDADVPNLTPELYMPKKKNGQRFKALKPTQIPRMYHSTSAVLASGEVLVAGSNENDRYVIEGERFPTELRVEKFSPPYLDADLDKHRPLILEDLTKQKLVYGQKFTVRFEINDEVEENLHISELKVTMLSPPFTTHGFSQQQRMLVLGNVDMTPGRLTVAAPANGKIAPPGYYILYLVHRGVPSRGIWVHIQN